MMMEERREEKTKKTMTCKFDIIFVQLIYKQSSAWDWVSTTQLEELGIHQDGVDGSTYNVTSDARGTLRSSNVVTFLDDPLKEEQVSYLKKRFRPRFNRDIRKRRSEVASNRDLHGAGKGIQVRHCARVA